MSGKRTALIQEGPVASAYFEAGYTFNIDPFPWTGFGPNEVFRRFLAAVDGAYTEEGPMYPLEPSLQVVFPDHRIDITSRIEHILAEFRREFEGDTVAIGLLSETLEKKHDLLSKELRDLTGRHSRSLRDGTRFLLRAPALIWHRMALSRKLKPLQHNRSLQRMIDAATLLFSNLDVSHATPFVRAHALTLFFTRQFYFAGGKHRVIDRLKDIFTESGGSIVEGCTILRLEMKDTISVDIAVNDENRTVGGRSIIVSEKWEKMKSLLFADSRFRRLGRRYDAFGPALYPFTLHIGVNDSGIPEKMGGHVILISEDDETLTNGNLLFIELSHPTDASMAPSGRRAVSISAFLDESPLRSSSAALQAISRDMLMRMERTFPFFNENIDHLNIEGSIDISRQYQEVICMRYSPPRRGVLGISPFPCTTPAANVFLTGGMTLAGLGFTGEVLSGIEAAQHVIGA
ncbi:MAG: hypothetical protein JW736_08945 [Deltaproteobacteria bacterium]|nr:hypothetical protein [Deltaproteobacteria bacterium]